MPGHARSATSSTEDYMTRQTRRRSIAVGENCEVCVVAGAWGDDVALSAPDEENKRPAHRAAEEDHSICLQKLCELRADTWSHDKFKDTPLTIAAALGRDQCVQVLLKNGANPTVKGPGDLLPVYPSAHCTHTHTHKHCRRYLLNARACFVLTPRHGLPMIMGGMPS